MEKFADRRMPERERDRRVPRGSCLRLEAREAELGGEVVLGHISNRVKRWTASLAPHKTL